MRKTLALFLVLIIALLSLYSLTFSAVNKEKDNVIVSEKYVYGDRSYADGIEIDFKAQYSENLLWDIDYDISSGQAKTVFSLHKDRIQREYESRNEIRIYTGLYYSTFGSKLDTNTGINKAFQELIETAEPYVEAKKVIYISDYTDYYPITVDVSFENFWLDSSFHSDTNTAEKELIKAMEEFFRIPVLKDHRLEIRVQVDENGNVTHSGTASVTEDGDYERFSFGADSVITDKECFIYFDNRAEIGENPDTSCIPGGYGIYSLPYSYDENKVTFDTEKLKNVFPLNDSESVYQMELSADGKYLYMMTKEGKKGYLTVIDAETYKEKSKREINYEKELISNIEYIGDDFMVITHYHPNRDSVFSVYTPDGNGGFSEEFTVSQYIEDESYSGSDDDSIKYAGGDFYMFGNEIDVKWDGERLYVTNARGDNSPVIREGNFSLSIYDKNGLQFCGEYRTSLTTGYDGYHASGYYVGLSDYDLIEIKLK